MPNQKFPLFQAGKRGQRQPSHGCSRALSSVTPSSARDSSIFEHDGHPWLAILVRVLRVGTSAEVTTRLLSNFLTGEFGIVRTSVSEFGIHKIPNAIIF